ncbi:MAG: rod shape-determining protein MreC [Deltaproteobacteria bacterium]|nr:rod shape-determining protein MreC [Deltaproteobacteria bacterium]
MLLASVLLCLISLHLASTDKKGTGGELIVRTVLSAVSSPIQSAITSISRGIGDRWYSYIYLVDLKSENEELRENLTTLKAENNLLREALGRDQSISELKAFRETLKGRNVTASVIGFSGLDIGGGWARTIILNKGSGDGVKVDTAAVTSLGVVGRIVHVDRFTSKVLLLTDPRSNVDIVLQRTRIKGLAEGSGKGSVRLRYIRQIEDVKVGDRVVTAGLSGIFGKGLFVGEIVSVEEGKDNFFKDIEMRAVTEIKGLEDVIIMLTDEEG